MTEQRAYTASEMGGFRNCRRSWWLNTYRRLRLKPELQRPSKARIGSLVHACLENLYEGDWGEGDAWMEPLTAERKRLKEVAKDSDVSAEWMTDMLEQIEFARIIVEGYIDWAEAEGADQGLTVLSCEVKVDVVIAGVRFLGKIDMLVEDQHDQRLFVDHKTTVSFEMLWNGLLINEQFLHYEMLNRADAGDNTAGAIINGLRRVKRSESAKPPFYERNRRYFGDEQVANYTTRALAIVRDIEDVRERLDNGESHQTAAYPRPNSECHWRCEFFGVCHMFDDGSRVEDFLRERYDEADPLDRYADKEDMHE